MIIAPVNATSDVAMTASQHDVAVAELDVAVALDGPAASDQAEAAVAAVNVVEAASAALDGASNDPRLLNRFDGSHDG